MLKTFKIRNLNRQAEVSQAKLEPRLNFFFLKNFKQKIIESGMYDLKPISSRYLVSCLSYKYY